MTNYYNNYFQEYLDHKNRKGSMPEEVKISDNSIISKPEADDSDTGDQKLSEDTKSSEPKRINYDKIVIDNHTNYKINIDEMLKEPLKISYNKSKSKVLIYHTHTTEGYLKNTDEIGKNVPSRTRDNNYNVVRVGNELTSLLKKDHKFNVIHNTTIHDSDFNKSYTTAAKTVEGIIKGDSAVNVVLDIHRDAMGGTKKMRPLPANIQNGERPAQIMFVVGTDARGLSHPNWRENLKLAIKLQQRLNEIYPGITKPIILSDKRYNQHFTKGSIIVEMGADGNTINEAVAASKYLAQAISDVLK